MRIHFINPINIKKNDKIYLTIIAFFIGIFTGFGAVAVIYMIEFFSEITYGSKNGLDTFIKTPWWKLLLIPSIGGLAVGLLIYFFSKESKGGGIPQIMFSILVKRGIMKPAVVIIKAITSSISIGIGASVGSEGPQAQIGAAISSVLGRFFIKRDEYIKILVAAGASSGIAAAFNTPLAGAIFATEVILGDFSVISFAPIIVATITSTVISQSILGNRFYFTIPPYSLLDAKEFIMYALLGILSALISYLFIKTLYFSEDIFNKKLSKIPEYGRPVLGGLLFGMIGIFLPHILGTGFDTMDMIMDGKYGIPFVLVLLLFKLLATNISVSSGYSGGLFAPSLFLGASLGVSFGYTVTYLFNFLPTSLHLWGLLGMSGVLAGTVHAPITATLMIFEMSRDYELMLPLMMVTIVSSLISTLIKKESIYTQNLINRGLNPNLHTNDENLRNKSIKSYINEKYKIFTQADLLKDVFLDYVENGQDIYPIINNEKEKILVGFVCVNNLRCILNEDTKSSVMSIINVKDIMNPLEFVLEKSSVIDALEQFAKSSHSVLPVGDENKKYIGVLSEHKLVSIYNNEYRKKELAKAIMKHRERNLKQGIEGVEVGSSVYIVKFPIPTEYHNKKIRDTKFRNLFNLEIILIIKSDNNNVFPQPDYVLKSDDSIMILGEAEDISKFKIKYNIESN